MLKKLVVSIALAAFVCFQPVSAEADELRIEVENALSAGGFFFTPVFLGFHDGSFDVFDSGGTASSELQTQAETGNAQPLIDSLINGQASGLATALAAPMIAPGPFNPGETSFVDLDVDTSTQRFFNFSSMVIPSNDAFFGNADAIELFDAGGVYTGDRVIEITAAMIYDAGTEVNDVNGDAAFSANGGTRTGENELISFIDLADLNNFVGTNTVANIPISTAIQSSDVVARVTISAVPEPTSALALGVVGLGMLVRRNRRKSS
jgi:hypothetical protein